MSKSILLVGATGFVGGKILNLIDDGNSKITLLSRKKLNHKSNLKQIALVYCKGHYRKWKILQIK